MVCYLIRKLKIVTLEELEAMEEEMEMLAEGQGEEA